MPNVKLPEYPKSTKRKNIIISTTENDKIYIGIKEIPRSHLDSLLRMEVGKTQDNFMDTVTVVINADTNTHYKVVFDIIRSAKKAGAKVVANVK